MRADALSGDSGGGGAHCEWCGGPFEPKTPWQRFDTTRCRREAHRAARGEKIETAVREALDRARQDIMDALREALEDAGLR